MLQDRYELQERLGAGGMAKVFLAFDHTLSRKVAIKMLHDDLVENEELRQRFLREARVFARLRHPAIIEIYDVVQGEKAAGTDERAEGASRGSVGRQPGSVMMVMEFVDGADLHHVAKKQPLRIPELAVAVLRPVMEALAHAHAEGVIHRDVKPANILLSRDGRVKLGDFGIAKVKEEVQLTQTGDFLGTPAYIAPEQARGEPVTAAVDQHAAAAVLYELLAGRPPYVGPTALAVISQILLGKCANLRDLNPAVDVPLSDAIHRALSSLPADRFADMTSFIEAVDACTAPVSGARERQLVMGLLADPATTIFDAAKSVADERVTTARRAMAAGDVAQAVAAAERALTCVPDHAEAKALLDTLQRSAMELPVLPEPSATLTLPRRSLLPAAGLAAAAGIVVGLVFAFSGTGDRRHGAPDAGIATAAAQPPARVAVAPPEVPPPPASAAATEPPVPTAVETAAPRPAPTSRAGHAHAPASHAGVALPAPADTDAPPPPPAPVETAAPPRPAPTGPGHLALITRPWAEVEIDGQSRGRTPYLKSVELSAGDHRLVLRNPGFPARTETIHVEPGSTVSRTIDLGSLP